METITCKYLDASGIVHSNMVDVLSVRGFDEPDEVRLFPAVKYLFADHHLATAAKGFQRVITVESAPISDPVLERFLQLFLGANTKSITYQGDSIVSEEIFVANE